LFGECRSDGASTGESGRGIRYWNGEASSSRIDDAAGDALSCFFHWGEKSRFQASLATTKNSLIRTKAESMLKFQRSEIHESRTKVTAFKKVTKLSQFWTQRICVFEFEFKM